MEDLVGAKFFCPHALADSNQHIWIREKTLEFSSTVLPTLSPYLAQALKIEEFALCINGTYFIVSLHGASVGQPT